MAEDVDLKMMVEDWIEREKKENKLFSWSFVYIFFSFALVIFGHKNVVRSVGFAPVNGFLNAQLNLTLARIP